MVSYINVLYLSVHPSMKLGLPSESGRVNPGDHWFLLLPRRGEGQVQHRRRTGGPRVQAGQDQITAAAGIRYPSGSSSCKSKVSLHMEKET